MDNVDALCQTQPDIEPCIGSEFDSSPHRWACWRSTEQSAFLTELILMLEALHILIWQK
jgi:hypothetical protein